jgi:hypothetical protein
MFRALLNKPGIEHPARNKKLCVVYGLLKAVLSVVRTFGADGGLI